MKKLCFKILLISLALIISPAISCSQNKSKSKDQSRIQVNAQLETDVDVERNVITGAERTELYFPLIEGKRVAVMSNQTGMVGNEHLVDMLIRRGHNVVGIFSPEHGFRGTADAGEHVSSSVDKKTGTPIWSLYGSGGGKPSADNMKEFDVLLFDLQDVGLRFYTYYISMMGLMDACAEHNKKMIVLDRPNPNGMYVDGPILDMKYKSGVGWLPIPVVHGMTLGELAVMINGEKWLTNDRTCDLAVVPCDNYTHQTLYELPVSPSPNLPNIHSIYLYPSTCMFEGTVMSLGRGTHFPFEVYGHPNYKNSDFTFTPRSVPGAKNPPLLNKKCYGIDLRSIPNDEIIEKGLDLSYIIDAYNNLNIGNKFFTSFFENLVGVDYIRPDIMEGKSAEEIKAKWADDVENFKIQRKPYLLYEE
ncbi:MAG: DUF1343 domain-containing protein [Fermentimonas sp.]|jgi:uncharacterized protein YbbC (DUF1343 family)|nr:DUF1343 domain-containing protein [Fermentimonas sp.]HBT86366.1 DUF1343 domain-containing protein [Porphyromonadaceae bacterium]MDD2930686.1 DUF1343 domain-containing protein [Fermentimonas sp.]MDD3189322.1 DUF1343 domain-containing protein [Fermentimonas sp.]MDD4284591.1 DUF1343 domain-containing protein [Fermentimonas sp.]